MEPLAPSVEKIVAGSLKKAPASEAPLLAWPVTCGAVVAKRTRALEFTRGVLRVEVPDSAWRTELQRLAPKYLAVMSRYVSGVSRIEFLSRKAG